MRLTRTDHRSRHATQGQGAVAGAVAAAVALGAGELVRGLLGSGPSLVTAVGSRFIDRFAGSLKDLAVTLFGTNDKAALIVGIVVAAVAAGAVLGRAAVTRPVVAVTGFAAFGALGLAAYLDDPQGETTVGIAAAVAAVLAGIVTLFALLRTAAAGRAAPDAPDAPVATAPEEPAAPPAPVVAAAPARPVDRRRFLVSAAALTAAAAGAGALGRRLGRTDVVATARRQTVLPRARRVLATVPAAQPFDVSGLTPYVTPTADFFRIDTALSTPQVDVASWRLDVTGLVDRPLTFTYDDLLGMDSVEDVVTLQCVSNEIGGNLVGNAVWQGVPLQALLDRAGVQPAATQVVGRSVDGWTAGFPTVAAGDGRTALVAFAMNGEPLPARNGFPARLVVAGLYGYVSATKWLREIELTTWEGFDAYWVPRGWAKEGPIKTMSRIDVPRSGTRLTPGPQPIAGVAWAPVGGVTRVEVQVDDGEWREAELGAAASGNTWVQWRLAWDAPAGEHALRVRATGRDGVTQTETPRPPAPDGATGWHRRTVRVAAP